MCCACLSVCVHECRARGKGRGGGVHCCFQSKQQQQQPTWAEPTHTPCFWEQDKHTTYRYTHTHAQLNLKVSITDLKSPLPPSEKWSKNIQIWVLSSCDNHSLSSTDWGCRNTVFSSCPYYLPTELSIMTATFSIIIINKNQTDKKKRQ